MQRLTGPGRAFVNFDGDILVKELQVGELPRVDTGHVAMFQSTVDFNVEIDGRLYKHPARRRGPLPRDAVGPGKAYLQTMPMGKLAQKIAQYMPQVGGNGASGGGNVDLGQLFGGR